MWRIFNYLFGWHYVFVHDCDDHYVRRVKMVGDELMGQIVSRKFFLRRDGSYYGAYNIKSIKPLTFSFSDVTPNMDNVTKLKNNF